MNAPCYKCEKRNPPCHDTCDEFKEFRSGIAKAKQSENSVNCVRMIMVESAYRKNGSKMK